MNQIFHTPRGEYLVVSSPVANNKLVDLTLDIYEKKDIGDGRFTFVRILLLPLVYAKDTEPPPSTVKPKTTYLSTLSSFTSK